MRCVYDDNWLLTPSIYIHQIQCICSDAHCAHNTRCPVTRYARGLLIWISYKLFRRSLIEILNWWLCAFVFCDAWSASGNRKTCRTFNKLFCLFGLYVWTVVGGGIGSDYTATVCHCVPSQWSVHHVHLCCAVCAVQKARCLSHTNFISKMPLSSGAPVIHPTPDNTQNVLVENYINEIMVADKAQYVIKSGLLLHCIDSRWRNSPTFNFE